MHYTYVTVSKQKVHLPITHDCEQTEGTLVHYTYVTVSKQKVHLPITHMIVNEQKVHLSTTHTGL